MASRCFDRIEVLVQPPPVLSGTLLAKRFEIQSLAGSGGMGAVYRAHDRELDSVVAIKVLRDRFSLDRFVREAELLASLDHPAIVRYVARGTTPDDEPWIAMEWVEGESLAERLKRGPLPVHAAVVLARQVADALARAHAASIVHRDIKPENLLLSQGDVARVKLLDFGIARRAGPRGSTPTGTGIAVGTPGYMAPEQARGTRDVGPAADVFSLGCVLFECIAGRPVFVAEHIMALLAKILVEEAPRLGDLASRVPPALDVLVGRMLAKNPLERPENAVAVLQALDNLDFASLPMRPSGRPPALGITTGEQELLSVIMAAAEPSHDAGTAPTMDAQTLGNVMAELQKTALVYGGHYEPLAGGAFVVTLRGQGVASDRVARAARLALVLRGLAPNVPLTVTTGRGRIAERWPVGEAIDRAAALLRRAPPPRRDGVPIRIDGITDGLIEARFVVERDDVGALLLGERRDESETRTLLGKPMPCVGRDRELSILEALFEECANEPVTRAALVTAPAGGGKSRIRFEVLRRIAARGARVLLSRADAMSAGAPFGLLAQAIGAGVGFVPSEPVAARRARLVDHLTALVGPERAPSVAPFLGEITGVLFDDVDDAELRAARRDPVLMGDQTARAFEAWIDAECARGPLALVLEDLHWGDLPTVRLIDSVLRGAPERPLFVLALARPEVFELFPRLWSERDVQHLRLAELTPKNCDRLVRAALGDQVADSVAKRIVERAGGNAFHLEELIRAASEGQTEESAETVLAIVEARLSGLPAETRRLLRAASVFGGVFWASGAARVLGGPHNLDDVARELDDLVARELVAKRPEARFQGETEYVFRHALLRDGAYATLTDDDRTLAHQLVGAWLADHGEPSAVVLAGHFERGGQPQRAVGFFRRAAEQALDANDFDAVLDLTARGLACGAIGEERGLLHLLAAEVHGWRGNRDDEAREGRAAMDLLPIWTPRYCDAARELLHGLGHSGKREALIEACEALLEGPDEPNAELVIALADGVIQRLRLGDYAASERVMIWLRTKGAAMVKNDPGVAVRVHLAEAWWDFCRGEPGNPTRETASLLAFEALGDRRSAGRAQLNLGYAYLELGQFELAEVALREAEATAKAMGLDSIGTTVQQNLGMTLAYLGRLDEAQAALQTSADRALKQGDLRLVGSSYIYLSRLALMRGNPADAQRAAQRAVELLEPARALRADAYAFFAESCLCAGDLTAAVEAGSTALEILNELGSVEEGEAHVRLIQAELRLSLGDRRGAEAAIRVAHQRLIDRAALIPDPAHRKSYLERIPDNARTVALARRLLDDL